MIRIISGKHKNRLIPTPKGAKYRPSTGKFREAIFSILTAPPNLLSNSNVLDLFSGTGSFGFEALSRGTKSVTFVDINQHYLEYTKQFASLIGELDNTRFLCLNALHLPKAINQYDIVFMDPPYHQDFPTKTINALLINGWLKSRSLVIIELGKKEMISFPSQFTITMERVYGNSKLVILQQD
jgi:16S rRNA (guanine966-N2)-methyltransferase